MPMIAPDGTTGDIPSANVASATNAGFKPATAMTSPDGKLGYIPNERVPDAAKSGFKPVGTPITDASTISAAPSEGLRWLKEAVQAPTDPLALAGHAYDKFAPGPLKELLTGGQSAGQPMGTRSGLANNLVTQTLAAVPGMEEIAPKVVSKVASGTGALFDRVFGINKALEAAQQAREVGVTANRLRYLKQEQDVTSANDAAQAEHAQTTEKIATQNRSAYEKQEQDVAATNAEKQADFQAKTQGPAGEQGEIAKLNNVMGSKPKIGAGRTSLSDAGVDAGRGLRAEGFSSDILDKLNPEQRGALIVPQWNKAGQAVDSVIQTATANKVTLDAGKSSFEVFKKIPDPSLQEKAIDTFNDTARDLGISNMRQATPEQARALRTALVSHAKFGPGGELSSIRGIGTNLYRAVSNDLHDAVPGLKAIDQHYADLNEAVKANRLQMTKFGAGKPYSRLPQPPTPEVVTEAKYKPGPPTPEKKVVTEAQYTPAPAVPSRSDLRSAAIRRVLPWLIGGTAAGAAGAGYSVLKNLGISGGK